MTARSGIPASEAAELEGLQYDAATARKEVGDTVHVLAGRVRHHPTAGQLAIRVAGAAVRRMTAQTRRAVLDQFTQLAGNRTPVKRNEYSWSPAVAMAGAALLAGVLAVAVVRHRQRATADAAASPGQGLKGAAKRP